MPDHKMMPHNLDAEQAVLGCLIIDSMCQTEIMSTLKAEDFYTDSHKNIFSAMTKVFQKNMPIDFVTLTEELEREGKIDAVGGIDYINFLSNVVPSAANYKFYVDIVKTNSVRRMLIKGGQNIIEKAYTDEDREGVIAFAEAEVYSISEKEETSQLEHVGKPNGAIKSVIDKFDKISKDPASLRGISTGFRDLDNITNGLQNSDLILLAARPSVGKTSFAMNVVTNIAIKENKSCAVFSLEMSKEQLTQRALCSLAKVPMQNALTGKMTSDEWKRIWTATKQLENAKLFIDDSSLTTPASLLSKCRRLKAKEGKLDLIMIDYLQLMTSDNKKRENRQGEISEISRNLKVAAKELNVPIIVLSQLSRDIEKREGHRPQLSDLRDSGAIEQDADIVMFLHNPEKYNDVPTEDEPGVVELILAKHRNGATGSIKLRWIGQYTTFVGLEEKVKYEAPKKAVQSIEEAPLTEIQEDDFDEFI